MAISEKLTPKQENLMCFLSVGKRVTVVHGGFLYAGTDYLGNGVVSAPLLKRGLLEIRDAGYSGKVLCLTAAGAIRMAVTYPVIPTSAAE